MKKARNQELWKLYCNEINEPQEKKRESPELDAHAYEVLTYCGADIINHWEKMYSSKSWTEIIGYPI